MGAWILFWKSNKIKTAALLFLVTLLAWTALAAAVQKNGVVRRVIDGDTFELETGERIRLIGIDTPEYQPGKNNSEFYGREASKFTQNLLSHRTVVLETDVEPKDKHGRTLAYAFLPDGAFVNAVLVEKGFARAKTYPPNVKYQSRLKNAQAKARAARRGLWQTASIS